MLARSVVRYSHDRRLAFVFGLTYVRYAREVQGHALNYVSHCPVLKARIRPSGYGHRSPSAGAAWLGSNIELRLVVGLEVADHEKVAAGKREGWSRIRVSSNKLDAMNGLHY